MIDTREPQIEERPEQPYLAIHRHVTEGVPAAVDTAFPVLFAWLGERGIAPSGPPFMRFREIDGDGEPLELEVAAPVAAPVAVDAPVLADTLPAGRYVTLLHVGPYRSRTEPDLAVARATLVRWAAERGLVYSHETDRGHAMACCVEHFRIGPVDDPDHTKWETEFAYLIVEG
jgi:hypothetical protein